MELERTLQDACRVSVGLGLDHIWIDAICIIQDDETDWLQEAAKMHVIYSLAQITIVGASGRDAQSGLFNSRSMDHTATPTASGVQVCKITSTLSDGRRSNIHLCLNLHRARVRERGRLVERGPWNQRAWTFQEYVFSQRILYYTDSQLFWQCAHGTQCEDGLVLQDVATQSTSGHDWCRAFLHELRAMGPSGEKDIASDKTEQKDAHLDPDDLWETVVREYSGRRLGRGKDFLIALAALAKVHYRKRPRPYYAGMWHDDLPERLCWTNVGTRRETPDYRAPSWSWASQDGHIDYGRHMDGARMDCKVMSVSTQLYNGDQFGLVVGGELHLEAKALPGEMYDLFPDYPYSNSKIGGIAAQTQLDSKNGETRVFTALYMIGDVNSTARFLLVVASSAGTYRRVGVAFVPEYARREGMAVRGRASVLLVLEKLERQVYRIV